MQSHWRHVPKLVLLASVLLVSGCQTIVSHFVLPRQGIRPAEYAVRVERNVTMTTADGYASLQTCIGLSPLQAHLPSWCDCLTRSH